eukprot:1071962-Amphidinium_carterae.1
MARTTCSPGALSKHAVNTKCTAVALTRACRSVSLSTSMPSWGVVVHELSMRSLTHNWLRTTCWQHVPCKGEVYTFKVDPCMPILTLLAEASNLQNRVPKNNPVRSQPFNGIVVIGDTTLPAEQTIQQLVWGAKQRPECFSQDHTKRLDP